MNHDSRNSSNLADSVRVAGDFFIYTASSHFNLFMHICQRQVNILSQYIDDIQIFFEYGFYFIKGSEKYLYFMSGEATNEI